MQGFVRVFKEAGYGFIVIKDTRQVYFHASQWLSESHPAAGDYVTFEIGPAKDSKHPDQAINVMLVKKTNVASTSTTEVK